MPYFTGIILLRYLPKGLPCEGNNQDLISGFRPQLERVELAHMGDRYSVERTERGPKNDGMMFHR
jgi:hypothetical protein